MGHYDFPYRRSCVMCDAVKQGNRPWNLPHQRPVIFGQPTLKAGEICQPTLIAAHAAFARTPMQFLLCSCLLSNPASTGKFRGPKCAKHARCTLTQPTLVWVVISIASWARPLTRPAGRGGDEFRRWLGRRRQWARLDQRLVISYPPWPRAIISLGPRAQASRQIP